MRLGASNQYFYYTRAGAASFMLGMHMKFRQDVDWEKFRDAVDRALKLYPELAARTVIRDGRLDAVWDEEPAVFLPDDGKRYNLGTDEVNGHMFYFRCGKNSVKMAYYHGLTDAKGILTFLRTVFLLYADSIGYPIKDEDRAALCREVRTTEADVILDDELDAFDPYLKYGNANAVPSFTYDFPEAFGIPAPQYPADDPATHKYIVEVSVSEFLKRTKAYGVSFVPMLIDILSGSIRRAYGNERLPVVTMVPADMRSAFGSNTIVNCSDGMIFPWYPEYVDKTVQERCAILKDKLQKQKTKEYFEKLMASKCEEVRQFEAKGTLNGLLHPETVREEKPKAAPVRRVTYATSYVGKIDLGYGLDGMLDDLFLDTTVNAFSLIIHTYQDHMRALVMQRSDDPKFPNCIVKGFEEAGFEVKFTDLGRDEPDRIEFSALRQEA